MSSESRDLLLTAIAKARSWVDDLIEGRAGSFAEIAKRESKVERHIRFLVPLAFVSPRIISGFIDGIAPARLGVTSLAKSLPWEWNSQETKIASECRSLLPRRA
jgi:site-specific DNA recombinase